MAAEMNRPRIHGDAVAHSFGLADAPIVSTKSLRKSQVAMSRLSIGMDQTGMSPRIPPEDTFILAMYLTDVQHHELWSHGKPLIRQGYARNSIRIVNLTDEFSAQISCPHESMVFHIPREVLNEFSDDAGGQRVANLVCEPGVVDRVIENLGGAILPAFDRPEQASSLFLDHAALAVCAHLATNYGGFSLRRPYARGGLTPRQSSRAKDYMAAHFAEDMSLIDVARECGLSRGYFAKAFKTTTGVTPHEWRQRYRLDRVKSMLTQNATSIAEIALACGFADQSHLTRVFSRLVGDSPANWRRTNWDWSRGIHKTHRSQGAR
jgi:AraC family transcriptional regulator